MFCGIEGSFASVRTCSKVLSIRAAGRHHPQLGCLRPSLRSRKLTTIVCAALIIVTSATVASSLSRESERVSPVASIDQTPRSVIEKVFATLGVSSTGRPQTQNSCDDFAFSFLNRKCSSLHKKHAARIHRVATLVLGHPEALPSSEAAQLPFAIGEPAETQLHPMVGPMTPTVNQFHRTPKPHKKLKAALKANGGITTR